MQDSLRTNDLVPRFLGKLNICFFALHALRQVVLRLSFLVFGHLQAPLYSFLKSQQGELSSSQVFENCSWDAFFKARTPSAYLIT